VFVELFQITKLVSQLKQVALLAVEHFDELEAVVGGQELFDLEKAIGDFEIELQSAREDSVAAVREDVDNLTGQMSGLKSTLSDLENSVFADIKEKTLEITLSEVYEDALKEPKTLARLREKTRAFFGADFEWRIGQRSRDATGVKTHSQRMPGPKRNHKLQVLEHPIVRQALEILGGELVDIRRLKSERGEPGADRVRIVSGESEETHSPPE